jgi:hypothetical protein
MMAAPPDIPGFHISVTRAWIMTDNTNPHKNPVMYGPAFECKKKVSGNGAPGVCEHVSGLERP